jgi:hypothetical protein
VPGSCGGGSYTKGKRDCKCLRPAGSRGKIHRANARNRWRIGREIAAAGSGVSANPGLVVVAFKPRLWAISHTLGESGL